MNLTQKQLASAGAFGERSIPAWEGGESLPELESVVRLAQVLETSVGWLIGEVPADGGLMLADAHVRPIWPMLADGTLKAIISDLSQQHGEMEGAALLHLERAVGELRTRARAAQSAATPQSRLGGVSSKQVSDAAMALRDAAADTSGRSPESGPKAKADEPSAGKRAPGSGAGKGS